MFQIFTCIKKATILLGSVLILNGVQGQNYAITGEFSGNTLQFRADTIRGVLHEESEKKKKYFFKKFMLEHLDQEQVVIEIVAPKMGLSVEMVSPGEKKGRFYEDEYREDFPLKPSIVMIRLPYGKPGSYELTVSTLKEFSTGSFEIRVFRSGGGLPGLHFNAALCERLEAILAFSQLNFKGMRGKYLSADRKAHVYKQSAYLRLDPNNYAYVHTKKGAVEYETILLKTEYEAVGDAFFKEFREELVACFDGHEKWELKEKNTDSNKANQFLFIGAEEPENSDFCFSFESNPKRRGYYQVKVKVKGKQ